MTTPGVDPSTPPTPASTPQTRPRLRDRLAARPPARKLYNWISTGGFSAVLFVGVAIVYAALGWWSLALNAGIFGLAAVLYPVIHAQVFARGYRQGRHDTIMTFAAEESYVDTQTLARALSTDPPPLWQGYQPGLDRPTPALIIDPEQITPEPTEPEQIEPEQPGDPHTNGHRP